MNKTDMKASLCCEHSFDKLFSLESIIQTTKDACMERESSSKYYGLSSKNKFTLSEERNHYINMLTMALDKVAELKSINNELENEIHCYYSKTPTIAAER